MIGKIRLMESQTYTLGFYLALLFQMGDFLTFALAPESLKIYGESNPLAAAMYGSLGLFGVVLMKVVLIGYLTLILPRLLTLRWAALILVGATGLLGMTINLTAWWITR
jgi:hypothetical protein